MSEAVLSVVVTVVDGGEALRRCLTSLLSQENAPAMEILVPFDSTVAAAESIVAAAAMGSGHLVRSLDLGRLSMVVNPLTASGHHELIDRRRAAGLASARGGLVAIIEDRSVPRPNWAATAARLHDELPHVVIGGAVESGCDDVLSRAVYFCDFGRYQLPFSAGPRRYVSDVNVTYKRRALDETRDIWRVRYHEPLVHWALERTGETLFLSPDLVVDQVREDLTLKRLLAERVAWGRLFGSLRAREASPARRLALVISAPLVPFVLLGRFFRGRFKRGTRLGLVLSVAPTFALLVTAWVIGEAAGHLTGRPASNLAR